MHAAGVRLPVYHVRGRDWAEARGQGYDAGCCVLPEVPGTEERYVPMTNTGSQPVYKDPSRPIDERVQDLLGRMTVDEKIAQLGSNWVFELLDGVTFS